MDTTSSTSYEDRYLALKLKYRWNKSGSLPIIRNFSNSSIKRNENKQEPYDEFINATLKQIVGCFSCIERYYGSKKIMSFVSMRQRSDYYLHVFDKIEQYLHGMTNDSNPECGYGKSSTTDGLEKYLFETPIYTSTHTTVKGNGYGDKKRISNIFVNNIDFIIDVIYIEYFNLAKNDKNLTKIKSKVGFKCRSNSIA